ncbi:MAG: macro domain-containing protein [Gammaproteobacteria bacterium]|nr:macro domain-containing protein [Gammaproteobacteria bacterium]NNJ91604.1 macro domain-containing protein [Gammaproteobacteria bacterium]
MMSNVIKFKIQDLSVEIRVGDIFSAASDVIVNPANGGLSHGGGLAAAISHAAGPALDEDGKNYVAKHGPLATGEAVPTTAGNLHYKAVIHTVGPMMGSGDEMQKLQQAITSCMEVCEQHGWQSMAMPGISTGIFGVPAMYFGKALKNALKLHAAQLSVLSHLKIYLGDEHYQDIAPLFAMYTQDQSLAVDNMGDLDDIEAGEVILSDEDISGLENVSLDDLLKDD